MDLDVNHRPVNVDCDPATPLLWVLRDHLNLTGTKFGCCGRSVMRAAGGSGGRQAHHHD